VRAVSTGMTDHGPLAGGHAIAKIPAKDLDRARAFYRDKLGLESAEEREGGLRYLVGATEFHVFLSAGEASGTATQMGFEVADIGAAFAELKRRGVVFEPDEVVDVGGNYPSKGAGERGAWFRDSEGNVLGLAQSTG
jgi:catechol 2,3-dioxygenase-like lactoylglutathione lyase family enzyme